MPSLIRHVIAGLVAFGFAGAALAAAQVKVTFKDAQRFADASERPFGNRQDMQQTLDLLSTHIQQLGTRYLVDGQTLAVEITEVDLAGRFEPSRGAGDEIRVLRDTSWPRIALHYTLTTPGAAPVSGQKQLVDQNYLFGNSPRPDTDRLRFEKRLLDRWFAETFAASQAAAKP